MQRGIDPRPRLAGDAKAVQPEIAKAGGGPILQPSAGQQ